MVQAPWAKEDTSATWYIKQTLFVITLTLYTQLYAKCRHNDGLEWAAAQASNADIAAQ